MPFSYSMSEIGTCPLVLVGRRLGLEAQEDSPMLETAAREGVRHEQHVADDLVAAGFAVVGGGYCAPCDRSGTHVEMEFGAIKLTGHIDRIVAEDGDWSRPMIAEIKSGSRFRAPKLWNAVKGGTFAKDFYQYACQVSMYHYSTQMPILYVVKNRDTGQTERMEIPPPVPLEEIIQRAVECEFNVANGIYPDCQGDDYHKKTCRYRHLKVTTDMPGEGWSLSGGQFEEINIQAVADYVMAKTQQKHANEEIDRTKAVLQKAIEMANDGGTGQLFFKLPDGRNYKARFSITKGRTTYSKASLEESNLLTESQIAAIGKVSKDSEIVTIEEAM